MWLLSQTPLLQVKLDVESKKKDDDKKKKAAKKADDEADEDDSGSGNKIKYSPSLQECGTFLHDQLEKMRQCTNGFFGLENDLVAFLEIEGKAAFNLSQDFTWLHDATQQLNTIINTNIVAPGQLLDQYKKFEPVINTDKKKLVQLLFKKKITEENTNPKATFEEIQERLEYFHNAEFDILNLSNDTVDFPIFRVQAHDLKTKLAKIANDIKTSVLKRIDQWCVDSVHHMKVTYEDMQKRIGKTPDDEAQLVELRDFIKKSKEHTMFELADLLKEVERHYELMDDYSYMYADEDIQNCLLMKQNPMIIGEVIQDGNANMTTKEEEFIQKLDAEKENFLKTLANMKADYAKIKTFKDPSTIFEFWKDSVALDNQINESIFLVEKFNNREARLNQQKQDYPDFEELRTSFQPFNDLLTTAQNMKTTLTEWYAQPLLSMPLDYESIENQVTTWFQQLNKLTNKLDEDFPDAADASREFVKEVIKFQEHLPLIKCIMSEALQQEDWNDIKEAIDRPELDPQQITIDKFEQENLINNIG
jgi:dynein heavy chain